MQRQSLGSYHLCTTLFFNQILATLPNLSDFDPHRYPVRLSILQEQCLKRRIGNARTLEKELAAWQRQRNQECSQIHWRFTTEDVRIKLAHLYPRPRPLQSNKLA